MTPEQITPPTYGRWIVLISIAVGVAAAWLASTTPTPASLNAPFTDFSASRAMADVRVMAAQPHPSGSVEIGKVRDYLASRLREMGIAPQVQHAEGVLTAAKRKPGVVIAGMVDNVVGVLPGRDPAAPAVLIMSHYDTMPNSPGAGDDTIGGAAALEIARVLKTAPDRKRDVIFLFTDGEEPGLLGAQAFFTSNPLARHVGVIINLEARGDAGRATMFETSPGAGSLIRLVAGKSPGPNANSLMAALYRVMPNDTDLTVALDHGYAGLNFAIGGDQLAYHTSLSTPEHLDVGSLQHMGDAVLPLARALANGAQLPAKASDLVYSDLMGQVLVAYPPWIGWVLAAVAAALTAASIVVVRRRAAAGWLDLARGCGGLLFSMLAAALCLHLSGRWLGGEDSVRVYALVARYPLLLAGATLIALGAGMAVVRAMANGARRLPIAAAAMAAGAACSIGGFDLVGTVVAALTVVLALLCLGRPTTLWGLWIGALIAGLAAALVLQALAPSGAFLVQWPLLLAALAAVTLLGFRIEAASAWGLAVLGVFAAVGFAQVSSWGGGFFLQMGPVAPELLALFVPLALLVLAPGLHAFGLDSAGRGLPLASLVLGAALLVLVGTVGWAGASPRQLTQLFYLADPAGRSFHHASATATLDPWSRAALGGQPQSVRMPLASSGRIWLSPAPPIDIQGPVITANTSAAGDEANTQLRIRPGAAGRQLKLLIQPTSALHDLTLNGRPLDTLHEAAALSLDRILVVYTAPPAEGIVIGFRGPAHGKFKVTALESRDGWPAGDKPLPPRPKALLTWGLSDTTIVQSTLDYGW